MPAEIVDGNLKMILGLLWTIILRFEIEEVSVEGMGNLLILIHPLEHLMLVHSHVRQGCSFAMVPAQDGAL